MQKFLQFTREKLDFFLSIGETFANAIFLVQFQTCHFAAFGAAIEVWDHFAAFAAFREAKENKSYIDSKLLS